MKKIAIFNCLKANECCIGNACLKAFNQKQAAFSVYKNQELELVAFTRCNGCHQDWSNNRGLEEKIERLITIATDIVHFGVCTQNDGEECPLITKLARKLQAAGVKVVRGCH